MLMSTLAFYIPSKNTIYLAKNDFATGIEFGIEQSVKFVDAPTVKCVPLADFDSWTVLLAGGLPTVEKALRAQYNSERKQQSAGLSEKTTKVIDQVLAAYPQITDCKIVFPDAWEYDSLKEFITE